MNNQPKSLERAPLLQEIQQRLREQLSNPILAASPVVKEIQARKRSE